MTMDDFAIWPPHEAFYIQSLLFNTRSAVASAERVSSYLHGGASDQDDAEESISAHRILDELQNIVQRGSAISRFFWPSRTGPKGMHEKRGAFLRKSLEISEESPIQDRELRNALVHFDERLDNYLNQGVVGHIIPEYVGPLPDKQEVPVHRFRAFYVDTGEFEILGDRFAMQPLVDEICRIHQALRICDEKGCRLPSDDEREEP